MSIRTLWIAIAAAVAVPVLIFFSGLPLGVPDEYVWQRRDIGGSASVINVALAFAAALIYIAIVDRLARRCDGEQKYAWSVAITFLVVAGAGVLSFNCDLVNNATGSIREPFVLYLPGSSGNFTEAKEHEADIGAFLRSYEDTVAEGEYLHQGTHPPGLILAYSLIHRVLKTFPALVAVVQSTQSSEMSLAYETIAAMFNANEVDLATVRVFALITLFLTALAAWPIASLLRPAITARTAIRVTALWPLVPALAIFYPKSDLLLPIFPLATAAIWLLAVRSGKIRYAILSGLVASVGLWISLGVLPAYAGIGIVALFGLKSRDQLKLIAGGLAGTLTPIILAGCAGVNIVAIWLGNLQNHAKFYDHNPRTYGLWLPTNLIEGTLATGFPIVVFAVLIAILQFKSTDRPPRNDEAKRIAHTAYAVLIAWVVLWISGKSMGEAARLWVVMTPWPLLALGLQLGRIDHTTRVWWSIAAVTFLTSATTIITVDGFDYSRLLEPAAVSLHFD